MAVCFKTNQNEAIFLGIIMMFLNIASGLMFLVFKTSSCSDRYWQSEIVKSLCWPISELQIVHPVVPIIGVLICVVLLFSLVFKICGEKSCMISEFMGLLGIQCAIHMFVYLSVAWWMPALQQVPSYLRTSTSYLPQVVIYLGK